ncbi:MAG: methionyl-tRNA formyltransferase, partial [Clostridia bacterium]|nr:methionyl-tRNA formyltransferase [Clostridia bacterium]
DSQNEAGRIISCGREGAVIACRRGTFAVREIQAAGGKRMPADAYFRGHGDMLGKILE